MAKLTREQHQALSGSALNTAGFFGGFIAALRNMYMPSKAEQANGNHFMSLVNMFDSLDRRPIFKDSTDANNEFSVDPFSMVHRNITFDFAGAVNEGPLTTGLNYIWLNILETNDTMTLGFGTGDWPTVPHIRLGTIDMPASGHWLPEDLTISVNDHIAQHGTTKFRRKLLHTDTGVKDVGFINTDAIVAKVMVWVKTAFNGTTPTLKVGDIGDDDRLGQTGDFTLTATGLYTATRPFLYTGLTQITSTLTIGGSPSTGEAYILLEPWLC